MSRYFGALFVLCLMIPTEPFAAPQKSVYSDSLVVVPGAKEIRFDKLFGTDQLTYSLTTEFPAQDFITVIKEKLKSRGWLPMEYYFFNPGTPTAHVRGWTKFQDYSKEHPEQVHQWVGDWKNDKGEVVTYALSYRYRSDKLPDLRTLSVTAVYFPKDTVDQIKGKLPFWEEQRKLFEEARKAWVKDEGKFPGDRFRSEPKHNGAITICLLKSGWIPSQGEIQFDSSADPLVLKVSEAYVTYDQAYNPSIEIRYTADDTLKMRIFSAKHSQRYIAAIVDGEVISLGMLGKEAENGALITGSLSAEKAEQIVFRIMK